MFTYQFISADKLTDAQKKDIMALLVLTDHEFIPPLSARNDTTQKNLAPGSPSTEVPIKYYETIIKQEFILAVSNDHIIGFMSYIPDHVVLDGAQSVIAHYITTVIVHPDFRGQGITEGFYRVLFSRFEDKSICTRTWSTNHAHLKILHRLGFTNILTLKNHRGEGIDTVYYCKTQEKSI